MWKWLSLYKKTFTASYLFEFPTTLISVHILKGNYQKGRCCCWWLYICIDVPCVCYRAPIARLEFEIISIWLMMWCVHDSMCLCEFAVLCIQCSGIKLCVCVLVVTKIAFYVYLKTYNQPLGRRKWLWGFLFLNFSPIHWHETDFPRFFGGFCMLTVYGQCVI